MLYIEKRNDATEKELAAPNVIAIRKEWTRTLSHKTSKFVQPLDNITRWTGYFILLVKPRNEAIHASHTEIITSYSDFVAEPSCGNVSPLMNAALIIPERNLAFSIGSL